MKRGFLVGWKLVRGTNLLLLALSLGGMLLKAGILLSLYQWVALLLGTISITAAGNLINDIFDQQIDEINDCRLIGTIVKESTVWKSYYVLNITALLLALGTKNVGLCVSYLGAIILLYAYSSSLKAKAWWGNLTVAFLCALSIIQLLWVEQEQWSTYWKISLGIYASFAFLTNWWRELIKDIQDVKGDACNNCQTLIVQKGAAYGFKIAGYLSNTLLFWLVIILIFLWHCALWRLWNYMVFVLFPITVYLRYHLRQLKQTKDVYRFSQLLKGYMLLGLIGVFFL